MPATPEIMEMPKGLADAFNSHDIDQVRSFFHSGCSLEMPRGSEPHGNRFVGFEAVRQGLKTRLERTPDVHYAEVEHFVV